MKTKNKESKNLYLHIIEPSVEIENFEFMNVSKIKKIKKKSIKEIYIGDLLDFIENDEAVVLLNEVYSKLTDDGKLYIQSSDARCLASSLIYNNINIAIFKNLLFGAGKKNIYSLGEIKGLLKECNIIINKCRFINAIQYYVECSKHD